VFDHDHVHDHDYVLSARAGSTLWTSVVDGDVNLDSSVDVDRSAARSVDHERPRTSTTTTTFWTSVVDGDVNLDSSVDVDRSAVRSVDHVHDHDHVLSAPAASTLWT
jgi:hypothetical protein